MRTTALLALAALVGWMAGADPAHSAQDCTELRAEIESAGDEPASRTLIDFHDAALGMADCDDTLIEYLLRRIAVAISREAELTALTETQRIAMLEDSLNYHRLWQVLKQLGDAAYASEDYTAATTRYQEALETIDDPEATADRHVPEREVVEEIFRLAEISRLLADEYVAVPLNRDGEPTGLGAPNVRGYEFSVVAVPITFVFAQTQFDQQGQEAALDLLSQLQAMGEPDIMLIGHTDPVGGRRYNQGLSEQRASTVAMFLRQNGYAGNIVTEGRGEDQPFDLPEGMQLPRDELHRLFRRVEMHR